MKTTEEVKEICEANPDDFIILYKYRLSGKWVVANGRCWTDGSTYKLIHIRHKDVLEAWLEDNSIEIDVYDDNKWWNESSELFITKYNPELEYRLKEKEDEHSSTSGDTDTTMDNSVDADNKVYKMTMPTKNHWYDDPLNFPVRLVRDTEQYTTYRWIYKREDFIKAHRQGFKLVTED